jgi:hypothetical protein
MLALQRAGFALSARSWEELHRAEILGRGRCLSEFEFIPICGSHPGKWGVGVRWGSPRERSEWFSRLLRPKASRSLD